MKIQNNLSYLSFVLILGIGLWACEPAAPSENIVEVAGANDNVSTLASAIGAADLSGTLSGEGPFTVFAPDNNAFDQLPDGLLEALLQDENKEALSAILTYHVVSGKLTASDIVKAVEDGGGSHAVTTVNGGNLTATLEGENVVLTDAGGNQATVSTTDVVASNGVIHVIDAVLVPGNVNPDDLLGPKDIVTVAMGNENFSTLVTAVQAAGLVETLQGEGPFTVFAPVNEAFAQLPEGALEDLLKPENKEALTNILTYHVVEGAVDAETLIGAINDNDGAYIIETVSGEKLEATLDGDQVIITDAGGNKATVVTADVEAANGVIHVIDRVVMPPS